MGGWQSSVVGSAMVCSVVPCIMLLDRGSRVADECQSEWLNDVDGHWALYT